MLTIAGKWGTATQELLCYEQSPCGIPHSRTATACYVTQGLPCWHVSTNPTHHPPLVLPSSPISFNLLLQQRGATYRIGFNPTFPHSRFVARLTVVCNKISNCEMTARSEVRTSPLGCCHALLYELPPPIQTPQGQTIGCC
jgi:hypothetical protein